MTLEIYKSTKTFPSDKRFRLISQMRRSSSSIPTNITEGCGRNGDVEIKRFMTIGMDSASELQYQLVLAKDLRSLQIEKYNRLQSLTVEVKKNAFIVYR